MEVIKTNDSVRLPRLLDANWKEVRRLYPSALSLDIERRSASTAEISLPSEDEPLPMLSFVELYTLRGSAGFFRVCQDAQAAQGENGQSYTLRHAIDTLRDSLWREQADFSGTMRQYLTGLLSWQTTVYWQLGVCEDTGAWKRGGLNYNRLDALLDEVRNDRPDYLFTYDFSTFPWTLNFVRASQAVDCEWRQARNLSDARSRRSRDGMCNKLYLSVHTTVKKDTAPSIWSGGEHAGEPTGKVTAPEDKTTETETVLHTYQDAASIAQWGVIEGTADIDTADVPDEQAWVSQYFAAHAQPQEQTSADGWEIAKATGEAWDQFDVGKIARVALPRPGFPRQAPIEAIRYPDLLSTPDKVRADLNKKAPKFSESLANLRDEARAASSAAGGAGRAAAKAEEVTHWAMVVQHILEALEGTGVDQLWETGIELDAEQGATIYSLYDGFQQTGAMIQVQNNRISQKVSVGDVSTELAVELGNVTISNGNLLVDGYVTANQLDVELANIELAINDGVITDNLQADQGTITSLTVPGGLYVGTQSASAIWLSKEVVTALHYTQSQLGVVSNLTVDTDTIYYLGR